MKNLLFKSTFLFILSVSLCCKSNELEPSEKINKVILTPLMEQEYTWGKNFFDSNDCKNSLIHFLTYTYWNNASDSKLKNVLPAVNWCYKALLKSLTTPNEKFAFTLTLKNIETGVNIWTILVPLEELQYLERNSNFIDDDNIAWVVNEIFTVKENSSELSNLEEELSKYDSSENFEKLVSNSDFPNKSKPNLLRDVEPNLPLPFKNYYRNTHRSGVLELKEEPLESLKIIFKK